EAGNEDEGLRRIGEGDGAQREIGQHIAGNVVDEDEEQREAAEEIEPEVARRTATRVGQGGGSLQPLGAATRTSSLPRFSPAMRPMNAFGACSSPSTTCSL